MYIKFNIPEIIKYKKGFSQHWINILFGGGFSYNYQIKALATTYVRLVEAALVEYRHGEEKIQEFWNSHESINISAMNRSMSHFESCLSNMHRAIKCFTRLRRHKELPSCLQLILNNEKPNFIANKISDQLRRMRNEIHHLEELVMDGRIQEGQSFALSANGLEVPHPSEENQTIKTIDRLVIAKRQILFQDLAEWLTEMGYFAEKISTHEYNKPKK